MRYEMKVDTPNYAARVVRLRGLRKHTNADRLQCVSVEGNNIIVGLNAKDGDLMVFFPLESQLSPEFATANNLVRKKDEAGNNIGGMFEDHRRVRCIKLRGEKSEGFLIEAAAVERLFPGLTLKDGDAFNSIGGRLICQKYVDVYIYRITRTTTDVFDIKRRLQAGESARQLAEEHSVDPSQIHHIRNGKAWARVPWPEAA